MTAPFDATRGWRADLDVRDWSDWSRRIREELPDGYLWPLIGARRSGKTWALRGIEASLEGGMEARYLDLRQEDDRRVFFEQSDARCLLLDEPGQILQDDTAAFLERCKVLRKEPRVRVVVAMSPREWALLRGAEDAEVSTPLRQRVSLQPLTRTQAEALARQDWALALLEHLEPGWRRQPFLLELLFELAEAQPARRADLPGLVSSVIERCRDARYGYVHSVFEEGLDHTQREALRAVAWDPASARGPVQDFLETVGLLHKRDGRFSIADPVLARHLPPPVIIHHLSDVHFGKKSARPADLRDGGRHAERLRDAAAPDTVREAYSQHLQALERSGDAPHLLMVTGDLAEWGLASELEDARAWLDALGEHLAPHPDLRDKDPRVLVVSGNHDVSREHAEDPRSRHRPFADAFAGVPHPGLEQDPDTRPSVRVRYPRIGLEVALLGSAEVSQEILADEGRKEVLELAARLLAKARHAFGADELESYERLRNAVDHIDPALVHHRDLVRLERGSWTQPLRLVLLHHPISPVPGIPEIERYSGMINAGAVKRALFSAGVQLALHGHQHIAWMSEERWPTEHDHTLHIAAAPSLGSTAVGESRGFNELRIHREGEDSWEVELRTLVEDAQGWSPAGGVMRFEVGG